MIDTHCHLVDEQYNFDREEVLGRMLTDGDDAVVVIACEYADMPKAQAFVHSHSAAYFVAGVHPEYAEEYDENVLLKNINIDDEKLVGIGEIGLDYHYDAPSHEIQKAAFDAQIKLAKRLKLPIIIHCRDAYGDCFDILKQNAPFEKGGIIHCFSGSLEWAKEVIKLGFLISFSGNLTFKNAERIRLVAAGLPIDSILVETDSPYLAPEGLRGRRNEPCNVRHVARMIASLHNMSDESAISVLDDNARRLFGIKK